MIFPLFIELYPLKKLHVSVFGKFAVVYAPTRLVSIFSSFLSHETVNVLLLVCSGI